MMKVAPAWPDMRAGAADAEKMQEVQEDVAPSSRAIGAVWSAW